MIYCILYDTDMDGRKTNASKDVYNSCVQLRHVERMAYVTKKYPARRHRRRRKESPSGSMD